MTMVDYCCADCGKPISRGAERCRFCAPKARAQGYRRPPSRCIDCGKPIRKYRPTRCNSCSAIHRSANPEYIQKLSKRAKERATPDYRHKQAEAAKKRWTDPEFRRRCSNAIKAALQKPEIKHKQSEGVIAAWKRGVYDGAFPNPSKLELNVLAALGSCSLNCISQYRPADCEFIYDIYLPDNATLIEVDGTYWHSLPKRIEQDAKKDTWAKAHGFTIIRISEEDIKKYGINKAVQPIIDYLEGEKGCA